MSYEESLRSITLNADSSLAVYTGVPGQPGSAVPNTGNQYRFVIPSGDNTVTLAGVNGAAIGVLQNKPQYDDSAATVGFHGVSNVVVGTGVTVTAGEVVGADADGRATQTGVTVPLGVALAGGGEGEIVPVLLQMN